jgi:hypothetical protein
MNFAQRTKELLRPATIRLRIIIKGLSRPFAESKSEDMAALSVVCNSHKQKILCVITNDATVKTILQLCHSPQAVAASHAGSPVRSGPERTRGRGDCGACAV